MHSPLRYMGGKSRLADRIVREIPSDHQCYVEPFCGAAWVYFAKAPSRVEVLNDGDGELVTFFWVVQNHLEEFLRYYKFAVVSRKLFELENRKDPATLTDVQRAVRYYYLQRLAFGGKTYGRTFGTSATCGPAINLATLSETLLEVHWRLAGATVENLDACECLRRYDRPETFFYCDPPYYGTTGYAVPFTREDYDRLEATLARVKGRFLVSLNDHPDVRSIFKRWTIRRVTTTYSVANGRSARSGRDAKRGEVLISNWG
jgi:DNA adenine methylase